MYNTAYYFWVASIDKWGGESAKVPSTPTNAMLWKGQDLVHFNIPWRMSGKTTTLYSVGVNETTTYTVLAGHCALVQGYHLHYGTGGSVNINVNDNTMEGADATTGVITRNPAFTNGMYLEYGDHVDLFSTNHAGNHGWVRILEFHSDDDVSVVYACICTPTPTYTVTAGKTLYLTFVTSNAGAGANFLQIYEGGGWVSIWDIQGEVWNLGKGVLQFPPGTQIKTDTGFAFIFGVEIKSD